MDRSTITVFENNLWPSVIQGRAFTAVHFLSPFWLHLGLRRERPGCIKIIREYPGNCPYCTAATKIIGECIYGLQTFHVRYCGRNIVHDVVMQVIMPLVREIRPYLLTFP
jgi:hypothetical protein